VGNHLRAITDVHCARETLSEGCLLVVIGIYRKFNGRVISAEEGANETYLMMIPENDIQQEVPKTVFWEEAA
jgi:hypothetical protein